MKIDKRPCKGGDTNVCVAEGCYAEACVRTIWTCPTCWEMVTVTSSGLGPAIIAAIEKRHQHREEDA